MKNTFSIFVSSVQKEFAEERRAVKDYITHDPMLGRFFPNVFLFEDLPAQDQRPDALYLTEIENRDLYIGLFGQKYGWKYADGLSPTAHEFHHATHVAPNTRIGRPSGAWHPAPCRIRSGSFYEVAGKPAINPP